MLNKRIIRIFIILLLINCALVPYCFATIYYVAKNGNDSTGDGLEGNPWLTIRHGCNQLSAGDTLYVKGDGENIVEYSESASGRSYEQPCCYPSNSGTESNPITIAAYSGHERLIRIIAPGTNGARPIGSYGSDWIVWDGFRLKSNSTNYNNGGAWIGGGANHITIKNCIFEGVTGITVNDNRQGVMIENSDDFHFHNNLFQDWWSTTQNDMSNAAIRMYTVNGAIIEYNEFNDCNAGIDMKGDVNVQDESDRMYIRYNLFKDFTSADNKCGIYGFHTTTPSSSHGVWHVRIYQNVFDNVKDAIKDGEGGAKDWEIYNNTIYDISRGTVHWGGAPGSDLDRWYLWNNIWDDSSEIDRVYDGQGVTVAQMANVYQYCNYNCYYNHKTSDFARFNWSVRTYSWWTGEGYDANDQTPGSSPLADPANGDYKLSSYDVYNPCYGTGRGGSYEDNMGAYVTGTETIGYDWENGDGDPASFRGTIRGSIQ